MKDDRVELGFQGLARNVVACLNAGMNSTYVAFRATGEGVVVGQVRYRTCEAAAEVCRAPAGDGTASKVEEPPKK